MRSIWTTPISSSGVPSGRLLGPRMRTLGCSLGCSLVGVTAVAGCLKSDFDEPSTTDIVLATGSSSETMDAADSSSGDAPGTTTSAGDSPETSGSSGSSGEPDPASSSSGEPELCGNAAIDPGEDCDGDALALASCSELDAVYTGGALVCDADCRLDTSACEQCEAPQLAPCDATSGDIFHAIELGCDTVDGFTGGAVHLEPPSKPAEELMGALDPVSYRVLRRFGAHPDAWTPRAGDKALLISTGKLPKLDAVGALIAPPGSAQAGGGNNNPDYKTGLPQGQIVIDPSDGGAQPFTDCESGLDCSNTLQGQWKQTPRAHDFFYLELQTVVPPGTRGYAIDLAFFSSHFPEYNHNVYNDMVVLWSQSEAHVGNVAYVRSQSGDDVDYGPMTLGELLDAGWLTYAGSAAPELMGTGYDGAPDQQGGATQCLTAVGPAQPGETLTLALAVFDLDDQVRDSALLLDNFRWSCGGCTLADSCGLRPAD